MIKVGISMSNYVPHYTKKKLILEAKEAALERLIAAEAPLDMLITAAEMVRDARVRVLQARRATIVPKDDAHLTYDRIDAQIQNALTSPVESMLAEFGYEDDEDLNPG